MRRAISDGVNDREAPSSAGEVGPSPLMLLRPKGDTSVDRLPRLQYTRSTDDAERCCASRPRTALERHCLIRARTNHRYPRPWWTSTVDESRERWRRRVRSVPCRAAPYRASGILRMARAIRNPILIVRSRDENSRTEHSRKKLSRGSPPAVRCRWARCEVAGYNESLVDTRHLSRTRSTRARSPVWPYVRALSTVLGRGAPNRDTDDRQRDESLHRTTAMSTVGAFTCRPTAAHLG